MSMLFLAALFALLLLAGHSLRRIGHVSADTRHGDAGLDVLYAEMKDLAERSTNAVWLVEGVPDEVVVQCVRREDDLYFYVEDAFVPLLVGYVVFIGPRDVADPPALVCFEPHIKLRAGYDHDAILSSIYKHGLREGYCLLGGTDRKGSAHLAWRRLNSLLSRSDVGPLERFVRSAFIAPL